MELKIDTHPRLIALANQYAKRIKALKEVHEGEIEGLYQEFREKYQCLKQEIEAQGGENDACSLTDRSADSPNPANKPSC